jgi:hypothetical protein
MGAMSASGAAAGMLLVQMQPPAAMEEEFHAWYDTEHIPEREAVPGFLTAVRFVCLRGWPRYMACYDLTSLDVLREQAYQAIGGQNLSIWSKRIISRVVGYERLELRLLRGTAEGVARQDGKVMIRLASDEPEKVGEAADMLVADAPGVTVRVFQNVLVNRQLAIMLDAPALELIPDWSASELRAALGELSGEMMGAWRYRRYVRWT